MSNEDGNENLTDLQKMHKQYRGIKHSDPMISEDGLAMPIKKADSDPYDTIDEEEEVIEEELLLRFIRCEHCGFWQVPDVVYSVDTYEGILLGDLKDNPEEDLMKDIKREVQSWCVHCIVDVRTRGVKYQELANQLDNEIREARLNTQKITSVSDSTNIGKRFLEQEERERKISEEMAVHSTEKDTDIEGELVDNDQYQN